MKHPAILVLFVFLLSCHSNVQTKQYSSDTDKTIAEIDKDISEKDTYKYMGHLRFPTYHFSKADFPTFDSLNFIYSLVIAHYDTLNRQITRIAVLSYKDTGTGASQTDDFYFDRHNRLIKISVLTHDTSPQYFATYYFKDNNLIYEEAKKVEVKDLKLYRLKIDSIYDKVKKELVTKKLIDNS